MNIFCFFVLFCFACLLFCFVCFIMSLNLLDYLFHQGLQFLHLCIHTLATQVFIHRRGSIDWRVIDRIRLLPKWFPVSPALLASCPLHNSPWIWAEPSNLLLTNRTQHRTSLLRWVYQKLWLPPYFSLSCWNSLSPSCLFATMLQHVLRRGPHGKELRETSSQQLMRNRSLGLTDCKT